MNLTYARDKFAHTPAERKKIRSDRFAPQEQLYARRMVNHPYSHSMTPPRKNHPNRAKHHRLNPNRRTVAQNRAAR